MDYFIADLQIKGFIPLFRFHDTSHGCSDIVINEEIEANRVKELSKITTDMDLILKLNYFVAYHCHFSDYKDEQLV